MTNPALPFVPARIPKCEKPGCPALSVFRIGHLSSCAVHTAWTLTRVVARGSSLLVNICRYDTPTDDVATHIALLANCTTDIERYSLLSGERLDRLRIVAGRLGLTTYGTKTEVIRRIANYRSPQPKRNVNKYGR